eukprot:tig00000215_g18532.t1
MALMADQRHEKRARYREEELALPRSGAGGEWQGERGRSHSLRAAARRARAAYLQRAGGDGGDEECRLWAVDRRFRQLVRGVHWEQLRVEPSEEGSLQERISEYEELLDRVTDRARSGAMRGCRMLVVGAACYRFRTPKMERTRAAIGSRATEFKGASVHAAIALTEILEALSAVPAPPDAPPAPRPLAPPSPSSAHDAVALSAEHTSMLARLAGLFQLEELRVAVASSEGLAGALDALQPDCVRAPRLPPAGVGALELASVVRLRFLEELEVRVFGFEVAGLVPLIHAARPVLREFVIEGGPASAEVLREVARGGPRLERVVLRSYADSIAEDEGAPGAGKGSSAPSASFWPSRPFFFFLLLCVRVEEALAKRARSILGGWAPQDLATRARRLPRRPCGSALFSSLPSRGRCRWAARLCSDRSSGVAGPAACKEASRGSWWGPGTSFTPVVAVRRA